MCVSHGSWVLRGSGVPPRSIWKARMQEARQEPRDSHGVDSATPAGREGHRPARVQDRGPPIDGRSVKEFVFFLKKLPQSSTVTTTSKMKKQKLREISKTT